MSAALRLRKRLTRAAVLARAMVLVLLATFFVPLLGGACCAGADWVEEVAESVTGAGDDCCPDDAEAETHGEPAPCSCPFPCSTGCAGFLGRALPQMSALHVAPAPLELTASLGSDARKPSNPEPRDILHVPRQRRA